MENREIKTIVIVTNQGVKEYSIGFDGVTKIKDQTIEYPDSIHWFFGVYGENEKLIAEIINCPVEVRYA